MTKEPDRIIFFIINIINGIVIILNIFSKLLSYILEDDKRI